MEEYFGEFMPNNVTEVDETAAAEGGGGGGKNDEWTCPGKEDVSSDSRDG